MHTTVSFCADESATIKNYFELFRKTYMEKVEYKPQSGGLIITEEIAEKFDFITAASSRTHHDLTKEDLKSPQKVADAMYEAYEDIISCNVSRYIGSMAHPFCPLGITFDKNDMFDLISDDRYLRLFEKTTEKGIAFEVNTAVFRKKVNDELIETFPGHVI